MNQMKESITCMQANLNKLLQAEEGTNMQARGVYRLSVMLDKEIVKYYRHLTQQQCGC